jgi:hypothetical protein
VGVSVPLALSDLGNGTVLIVIALVVLPIAALAFAGSGSALKTLGKGRFAIDQDLPPRRTLSAPAPIDRRAQEAEVRQMVEAKSYRRQQRGEPPLDVEAETRRLLKPAQMPAGCGRASRPSTSRRRLPASSRTWRTSASNGTPDQFSPV